MPAKSGNKKVPHPEGVYPRYTWMGSGWMPRQTRKSKK